MELGPTVCGAACASPPRIAMAEMSLSIRSTSTESVEQVLETVKWHSHASCWVAFIPRHARRGEHRIDSTATVHRWWLVETANRQTAHNPASVSANTNRTNATHGEDKGHTPPARPRLSDDRRHPTPPGDGVLEGT